MWNTQPSKSLRALEMPKILTINKIADGANDEGIKRCVPIGNIIDKSYWLSDIPQTSVSLRQNI